MKDERIKQLTTLADCERACKRFETFNDSYILPDLYLVIRVDGRRFSRLGDFVANLERPYDLRVRDAMLETAGLLMGVGCRVRFAVVQSDEISLLLDPTESINPRRRSKLLTIFASEASLAFSQRIGGSVPFCATLSELPSLRHVRDYFYWRRLLQKRNCVVDTIYHLLLQQGLSAPQVAEQHVKLGEEERQQLLKELGCPLEKIPLWQRLGVALWWAEDFLANNETKSEIDALINVALELPLADDAYLAFLDERLQGEAFNADLQSVIGFLEVAVSPPAYKVGAVQKRIPGPLQRVSFKEQGRRRVVHLPGKRKNRQ